MAFDFLKTPSQLAEETSYNGMTQFIPADTLPAAGVNYNPTEVDPNRQNIDTRSAFGTAFGNAVYTSFDFIANVVNENSDRDLTYQVFQDPILQAQGPEFIANYGRSFIDSPNQSYTRGLIEKTYQSQRDNALFAQNPVSSLLGTLGGSIFDPASLLFIAGAPVRVAGVAANIAVRALEGGLLGGAYTAAQASFDPTVTNADIALNTVIGAGFGGVVGVLGGFAGRKSLNELAKWYDKGEATSPPIKTDTLDSVGAARNLSDMDNSEIAQTNGVFKAMHKVAEFYAPAAEMEVMSTPSMREMAKIFGGSTTITKGNLKGLAGDDAVPDLINAALSNKLTIHEANIDKAYVDYGVQKGTLNSTDYTFNSFLQAGAVKSANDPNLAGAAKEFRGYFDDYLAYSKENNLINKDANIQDNWLMQNTDHDKIVANYGQFKEMLTKKVRPGIEADLGSYLDEATKINLAEQYRMRTTGRDFTATATKKTPITDTDKLLARMRKQDPDEYAALIDETTNSEVNNIADDIRNNNNSLYRSSVSSYKAKSLKFRTLNLTNDEIAPYLRTDITQVVRQYSKSIETTRFLNDAVTKLRERAGNPVTESNPLKDPYFEIEKIIKDDYSKLIRDKELEATRTGKYVDGKDVAKIQTEQTRALQLAKDQLDLLTGAMHQRDKAMFGDTVRNISAVLKFWNTLRLMGTAGIATINDVANAVTSKVMSTLGLDNFVSNIVNKVVTLNDHEKAIFGAALSEHTASSRAVSMSDIFDSQLGIKNKGEKIMDKTRDLFFTGTLFNFFTSLARSVAVKDAIQTNLKRIEKLINGTLEHGSYDQIELNTFGYGKNNIAEARKVLDQFNKHKTVTDKFGGEYYYSNIDKWDDADTATSFTAKVIKERNRIVAEPDNGTRPAQFYNSLGGVVLQFKGFTMSAFFKQVARRAQTFNLTTRHAQAVLASLAFQSTIGAFTGYARDMALARDVDVTPEKTAFYAFDRGGFFAMFDYANGILDQHGWGLASQLGVNKASKFSQQGDLEPLLGPSFGLLNRDAGNAVKAITNGVATPKDFRALSKLIPLQNTPYYAQLVNLSQS